MDLTVSLSCNLQNCDLGRTLEGDEFNTTCPFVFEGGIHWGPDLGEDLAIRYIPESSQQGNFGLQR